MNTLAIKHLQETEKRNIAELLVPKGQKLQKAKIYLHLYHGRNGPDEDLDDWGFEGPTFGPLDYFHITYLTRFCFARGEFDHDLSGTDDLFEFDRKYYGDLVVFLATGDECG
jgi:hypothetical protein